MSRRNKREEIDTENLNDEQISRLTEGLLEKKEEQNEIKIEANEKSKGKSNKSQSLHDFLF